MRRYKSFTLYSYKVWHKNNPTNHLYINAPTSYKAKQYALQHFNTPSTSSLRARRIIRLSATAREGELTDTLYLLKNRIIPSLPSITCPSCNTPDTTVYWNGRFYCDFCKDIPDPLFNDPDLMNYLQKSTRLSERQIYHAYLTLKQSISQSTSLQDTIEPYSPLWIFIYATIEGYEIGYEAGEGIRHIHID